MRPLDFHRPRRTIEGVRNLAFGLLVAAAVVAPAGAATVPAFRSPSGNIRCVYAPPGRLFCSIGRASYAATLQDRCLNPNGQKGAGVDWHGWELRPRARTQVLCSGGILYTGTPKYVTVPYGQSWRRGSFTCLSRASGVTCRTAGGHGLFAARETFRIW